MHRLAMAALAVVLAGCLEDSQISVPGGLEGAAEAVGEVAARGGIPVPGNIYMRVALDATPFVLAIETITPHPRPDSVYWILDGSHACGNPRFVPPSAGLPKCKVMKKPFYQIWRNGYALAIWRMVGPWGHPCYLFGDLDIEDCMHVRYEPYYGGSKPVGASTCSNHKTWRERPWEKHPWQCLPE